MSKTISGIVTWLKQWFYSKDDIYDSGWQDFPFRDALTPVPFLNNGTIMTPSFASICGDTIMKNYDNSYKVRIRRVGKIVHIEGAMTSDLDWNGSFPLKELCAGEANVTTYNSDCYFTVGTLDPEFRPSTTQVITIQQGSGINKYQVRVNTNGAVKIGRYGTTDYANPQLNPWLNINISYLVG